ncbi:MAG: AMP-binding protein, partial [Actinomycetota bacterium]
MLVVDQRLPDTARRELIRGLGVHSVVDATGRTLIDRAAEPMNEGDAVVIATSGTSGSPKGVVHTHASLRAASRASSAARSTWLRPVAS